MKSRTSNSFKKLLIPNKGVIALAAISGVLFNVGLVFIPLFEGWLAKCLADIINGAASFDDMLRLVAIYVTIMLFVQLTRFVKRYYVRRFANNLNEAMRDKLYHGIISDKKLNSRSLGEMTTRAVSDIEAVSEGARKTLTEIFDTGILILSYEVTLFILDYKIALIGLIFTPISFIVARLLKKPVFKTVNASKLSAERLSDEIFSRVKNATLFRVCGREDELNVRFDEMLSDYERKAVKADFWQNTLQPLYNVIAMIGVIFIIYLGAKNYLGVGFTSWDVFNFTAFIACYTKIADKSSKAAKLFNTVQKARVCFERVKPRLEPTYTTEDAQRAEVVAAINADFDLSVDRLCLGYGDRTILSDLSFKAKIGEIVGVTGPVASGKSTIGKAFLCEEPYTGSVKLGGYELDELNDAERNGFISYLGHAPELMSFSIEENVLMGDDLNAADFLKTVRLDKEIAEMAASGETFAGNAGARLSGGQQARVALARTLAHIKKLVVLDDPFSAVDKKTERETAAALLPILSDKITVFISHRLGLFPSFSKIIWVENGACTVSTHNELYKNNAKYRELYDMQEDAI